MLRRALLLVPSVLRSCRLSAALNATTTSADSSRARTREVSPGKVLNFPLGPSGSTCSVLMRIGFRAFQHADRPLPASLPVRVPMVAGLPAASFSSTLAGVALRFSYGCSHQLRCHRFMSLVKAHAGHTGSGVPPLISRQAPPNQPGIARLRTRATQHAPPPQKPHLKSQISNLKSPPPLRSSSRRLGTAVSITALSRARSAPASPSPQAPLPTRAPSPHA